ncbi:apolipoprotein N-acyltransferase [Coraliomargarita akajimensis]|uniref:Apolipoprotein N-acyltransferase n=1 Tax=Coraliomargarita akajimensis (strain DSM 45221 / IAM 15411 / JCM 23193 / KCTC 12865 / 04OKA010-24) TaxID=583355 RepID=D5ELA2_CORAD|nr:apolipoprotein N-acyltransferase [Coraliomargarita akajimensis]ADE55038.1 apolipoprotein N-acyltransferase [Coraliomargarita akajimensis DSM 45221]
MLWGILAGVLSTLLWVLSIPPFDFAEGAYVAFVPMLLWLATSPSWKVTALISWTLGFVSWFVILIWLRHVTFWGTVALAAIQSVFYLSWFVFARWIQPRAVKSVYGRRLFAALALAGAWVVLEWVRTWLFWGFPWAPMALSQWQRPVILQVAAWAGSYGVSFLLLFFNVCVAQTLWQRATTKERKLWSGWFSPDLYAGMGALAACIAVFFNSLPKPNRVTELFTAGVVQPYIPADLKWEAEKERQNLEILGQMTRFVGTTDSDLLLWPEAATPWPVVGVQQMRYWIEDLSDELSKPILMGNLAWYEDRDAWYNGAFLVEPETGLREDYYVKRELVPFGEYVPKPFGFIGKFVPVGGDFIPGEDAGLIELQTAGALWRIGSLICYEDVFPALARESAQAGAQVFFVATNNAWYGEEGGAPQHAAHSVLRAVETRRPVMRCGNGGWSGWIDAYGTIREVILNEDQTVYFRGGGNYTVFQYDEWIRQQSFYTRHGDWFVWLSIGLVLVGGLSVLKRPQVTGGS